MVITCYNETEVDVRALNLTNQVGTIDIVPVNFSYPSGSFRVESDKVFTHFTASITAAAGNHVFKITGFTAINKQVIEYYYQLDYLKDYWFRNSSNNQININNTFVISEYDSADTTLTHSKFALDTKVTGVVEDFEEKIGSSFNFCVPMFVMMSAETDALQNHRWALNSYIDPNNYANNKPLSPEAVYFIKDVKNVKDFYYKVLVQHNTDDDAEFKSFYCNILRAFYAPLYLPNSSNDIVHYLSNVVIPIYMSDGTADSITMSLGEDKLGYITLPVKSSTQPDNGIITQLQATGITVTITNANDLPPYKKYEIFIPYIGWYTLPIQDLFRNQYWGEQQVVVKYFMDLFNGQIAAEVGIKITGETDSYVFSGFRTPFVSLPRLLLPTSSYAYAQSATDASYQNKTLTNMLGTGAGIIGGLAMGHPLVAAGAFGAGLVGQISTDVQHRQANDLNQLSGFTAGVDNNIGKVDRLFKLKITEYHCGLSYTEAAKLYGYPINDFYDTLTFNSTTNRKFWVDLSTAHIKGTDSYAEGVRTAYNMDYVTVV